MMMVIATAKDMAPEIAELGVGVSLDPQPKLQAAAARPVARSARRARNPATIGSAT